MFKWFLAFESFTSYQNVLETNRMNRFKLKLKKASSYNFLELFHVKTKKLPPIFLSLKKGKSFE